MTALAGILCLDPGLDARRFTERMLGAQSAYANRPPRVVAGREAALGCALYATLPEDGAVSFVHSAEDGAAGFVADVRLDDRSAWVPQDSPIAAASDAALLARAWEAEGAAVVPRIRGDFALAAIDFIKSEIVLARDFLGQRPLFFSVTERWIAFASMPVGLLAILPTSPSSDRDALTRYLEFDPQLGRGSFFAGISTVLPGEIVRLSANGQRSDFHWQPPRPQQDKRSPAEIDAEALRLFDRAVASRLRGRGRQLGCQLSGGLDSSGVMASAASQIAPDGSLIAFTAVPPVDLEVAAPAGRFLDESDHAAAAVARFAAVQHVIVRGQRVAPTELWDRAFALFQAPPPNPCNYAWNTRIFDEAKARGIGVLLTGALGNLSISFDPPGYNANLLAGGSLRRLMGELRGGRARGRTLRALAADLSLPFLPRRLLALALRVLGREVDVEQASLVRRSARRKSGRAIHDTAEAWRQRDSWKARVETYRLVDMGVLNKGILAGWGIDLRDPTADQALVEFCLDLPDAAFRRHGWGRALARRVFASRLPAKILEERRRGYQAADWRRNLVAAAPQLALDLDLVADDPVFGPIVDRDRARRLVDDLGDDFSPGAADELVLRRGLLRTFAAAHFVRKASRRNY